MPSGRLVETWLRLSFRPALEELRIAQIRALVETAGAFLEVRGELVLRQRRRLSDHANHPDPMLELDGAAFRRLVGEGPATEPWEEVEQLSLNRDHVVVIIPTGEDNPGGNPQLVVQGRPVRVKLLCRSLEVTGFVNLPMQLTVPAFLHETRGRFLAITEARVMAGSNLADFSRVQPFCLVNREHVVACIETRGGRES